jgi:HEAT repeat protein
MVLRATHPGTASYALGKIGRNAGPPKAEKAVPALIQALKDKDRYVRIAARIALKKIQKK